MPPSNLGTIGEVRSEIGRGTAKGKTGEREEEEGELEEGRERYIEKLGGDEGEILNEYIRVRTNVHTHISIYRSVDLSIDLSLSIYIYLSLYLYKE